MENRRSHGGSASMGLAILKNTLGNATGPISMLLIAPFLSRALEPDGRGLVAAATIPLSLLSAALTLGMPEAMIFAVGRKMMSPQEAFRSAQTTLFISALFAVVAVWLLAPFLSAGNGTVENLIKFSCLFLIPMQFLWGFRGLAQGIHDWKTLNLEKLTTSIARVLFVVVLFSFGLLNVITASLAIIAAPLFGIFSYVSLYKTVRSRSLGTKREFSFLSSFGSKVWLGSISGILLSRLDQLLIAPLSNVSELGYYAVGVNVGDIALFGTSAAATVLLAKESASPNNERISACSSILFCLIALFTVPVCLTANWWLPKLFGAAFQPSVPIAIILLLSTVISASGSIAGSALTARGKPQVRSIALGAGLTANVISIILTVPQLGALGAALATLIGMLTMTTINLFQLNRFFGIKIIDMFWPSKASCLSLLETFRQN